MFLDSKEKKDIKDIIESLKKNDLIDKNSISKLESIYK